MNVELFDAIKELQNSYESLIDEIATTIKLRKGIDIGTNQFLTPEIVPIGSSIDLSNFPEDFAERMDGIGELLGGDFKTAAEKFHEHVKAIRARKQTFESDKEMISFIREELNTTLSNLLKGIVLSLPEKSVDTDEDGNLFII